MKKFSGFPNGKLEFTQVPFQFFSNLLPEIDNLGEMKVILYVIWFIEQQEQAVRYITLQDFMEDELFMQGLGKDTAEQIKTLDESIELAVKRGALLEIETKESDAQKIFFLNSQRGRNAYRLYHEEKWQPEQQRNIIASLRNEPSNIFRLYEQNIGPLTPLMAEELGEAETTYSSEWIEEAFRKAVESNVRKWSYVKAILRSWQEKGRDGSDRGNSARDRRSYIEGELSDFIRH